MAQPKELRSVECQALKNVANETDPVSTGFLGGKVAQSAHPLLNSERQHGVGSMQLPTRRAGARGKWKQVQVGKG